MQLYTPDFFSLIHRTLVDIAALVLLVIGLARLVLNDWKTLVRKRRKKPGPLPRSANEHTASRRAS